MNNVLLFGVPVLAIFWSLIAMFKETLDKVVAGKFTLTQLLMALTLGLASLAAAYEAQLSVWIPNLPEYVKAFGILTIPALVFLGVWQPLAGAAVVVKNAVRARLVK